MKRLVICCDGTWNRADSKTVTNIEKIARTVQLEPSSARGVHQMVLYLPGVGTAGYQADKILGGAFGFGLFHQMLNAYRFLSINYQPGDELYVFGFSRGAYTARSLAGMIGKVGLLTRDALIAGAMHEAAERYQHDPDEPMPAGWATAEDFRSQHCHPQVPIHFLGVFDTVGALGVPGPLSRRHSFHDVRLGDAVEFARQALAVDEPRMKFEPCLWLNPDGSCPPDRIKQVWFEGAHSDVGGGYAECGLSDTALLWMVTEAQACGLVFDCGLFRAQLGSGSPTIRHDPSKPVYAVLNAAIRLKRRFGSGDATFAGSRRRLHREECAGVRLAKTTAERYQAPEGGYRPANLDQWTEETRGLDDILEDTIVNPSDAYDGLLDRFEAECRATTQDAAAGPAQASSSPTVETLPH